VSLLVASERIRRSRRERAVALLTASASPSP
jgi:hypothetical protein